MSTSIFSFKQALNSNSINYYSFKDKYASLDKYASSKLKYNIFCCVWAIATLFHIANIQGFSANFTLFSLTTAAIILIAKPSSLIRLLIFISLQLYNVYGTMPNISNHWLLTAIVNLTILHTLVYLVLKRKTFYIDKAEFLETFAPLVKIELIILYFYAVFHKLNAGFFDTEASCAVEFILYQNVYYNFLPDSKTLLSLNIYFTLIVETLIPLLICIRKTRYVGILIGLLFHWVIAYNPINGFYDFSSFVFAIYFLFTSTNFSDKINSIYTKLNNRKVKLKNQLLQFNLINLAIFALILISSIILIFIADRAFSDYFRHIIWTGYSFIFILVFVLSLAAKGKEKEEQSKAFPAVHYSLYLVPLLAFLNGLSPYLGLKTETSYTMFSNLRTEGGVSNHYIMPASLQIFDYQKDVVEVVSSSSPQLQRLPDDNKLVTFFRFKQLIRWNKPEKIEYIRNGERHTFEMSKAQAGDELLQSESYLANKFLGFREFTKNGVQKCSH